MTEISTFVFFDLETTSLPWLDKYTTRIIEFSFVAVLKEDILASTASFMPPMKKLSGIVNPEKRVSPASQQITGLTTKIVKKYPKFINYFDTILHYFNSLKKPVCIVAHNGNRFDFKIFQAECCAIGQFLPPDILCLDSLPAFRQVHKKLTLKKSVEKPKKTKEQQLREESEAIMTSDSSDSDDNWSDIDEEELYNIENTISEENISNNSQTVIMSEKAPSFQLGKLYEYLTGKVETNAHRAEADCLMLLECVVRMKNAFIENAQENCKLLQSIEPYRLKIKPGV